MRSTMAALAFGLSCAAAPAAIPPDHAVPEEGARTGRALAQLGAPPITPPPITLVDPAEVLRDAPRAERGEAAPLVPAAPTAEPRRVVLDGARTAKAPVRAGHVAAFEADGRPRLAIVVDGPGAAFAAMRVPLTVAATGGGARPDREYVIGGADGPLDPAAFADAPEAVAVIDAPDAALPAVAEEGRGAVLPDLGLAARRLARTDGLRAAAIAAAADHPDAVAAALDRAAFAAARDGAAVVRIPDGPAAATALGAWLASRPAARVQPAPLSAVLPGG